MELIISVENLFKGEIIFKNSDFKEIKSTKSGNEHGYGLKNVYKAVSKYNGELKISTANNVFSVVIMLLPK